MDRILVSPNPHIHAPVSTRSLMRDVVIALLPASLVSVIYYGLPALVVFAVSIITCVGLEYLIERFLMHAPSTVGDLSAVVTGLLLAMNLPSSTPWWVVMTGAAVAIGVAKMTFGGIGQNVFNPALVGRVFLLVSFPAIMTTWVIPGGYFGADAITSATPLGLVNEAIIQGKSVTSVVGDYSYCDRLFTFMGGSAGEASVLALLAGWIYLLVRRVVRPHITVSIWATVAVISLIFWLCNPERFTDPLFNLLNGGMILGSCFMATDYVTSPMSTKGGIIFGVGIGFITMMIRYFGSYPEGVSFAILIMNATVPLINMFCHQKKYGRK
ncbi:MAG: RnfABCDGE type electron transport complex subunit D [Candidatus Cryptobacteroides sp.]